MKAAAARYLLPLLLAACAARPSAEAPAPAVAAEAVRVLALAPGVTATIVAPAALDTSRRVDLILYALPNGNTTAETIGRRDATGEDWRYDIQHIGAQTRALRTLGLPQAVVVYLEADTRSWPAWRRAHGYEQANARIVGMVDQLRRALGSPPDLAVTLAGHSGGGSFAWGFLDGQAALPDWLERVVFLDSNYSFEPRHGEKLAAWLQREPRHTLVVLAYDDREVLLDGRRVVSDSGGTWRASQRLLTQLRDRFTLEEGRLGEFLRYRHPQIDILLHPNPENRILHTALVGELNGYMHALLSGREAYERGPGVLHSGRGYERWIDGAMALPEALPPPIPARRADALTGTAFIRAVADLPLEAREAAILRELLDGNIPSFLRRLRTVTVSDSGPAGARHTVAYEVMPDYLAIGSDDDWVRIPMNPYTAQAFADAFGFVLPTRKMVDDIWAAARVHADPRPLTEQRESPLTFLQHHRIIEAQLDGVADSAFVAGIKKDVVLSNRLLERPNRVAIYGWHYLHGKPIQPVYAGHVDWYVDYSHGIRPVRRALTVDGRPSTFEAVLADPALRHLLSDEGELHVLRYEPTPADTTGR